MVTTARQHIEGADEHDQDVPEETPASPEVVNEVVGQVIDSIGALSEERLSNRPTEH